MDNQRLILFVILALLVMTLWQAWEREQRPTRPAPNATTPAAKTGDAPAPPPPPTSAPAIARAAEKPASAERIEVVTNVIRAEIDTLGGDLVRIELLRYPVSLEQRDRPVRLVNDTPPDLFLVQTGLIGREGSWPNHKSLYRAEQRQVRLADGQDRIEVRLNWSGAEGARVTKVYTFRRDDYVIDLAYEIENPAKTARETWLYAQMLRPAAPEGNFLTTLPTYFGAAIYSPEKKYEKIPYGDMAGKPLQREVTNGWVGMLQHYFVGAFLPKRDTRESFYSDVQDGTRYVIGYKDLDPTTVAPGARASLTTRLYVGPKENRLLEKLPEGMDLTVDYGALTFIAAPLFWLLAWIHRLVGNWGWAIIILTILVKAVFYPLSVASYRSMAKMRKLQPRLVQLRERFGDDRQKLNQATMELYRSEKINPLGGCLPILVQIPVFIALYWVLLESVELRQAPFALWIKDLSVADPYYVLPLIMGVTMFAQTLLNPQPVDPVQKKVMLFLPVMFTVFFVFFPAGLVLYWVVQNVLSIAQQWSINRAVEGAKR